MERLYVQGEERQREDGTLERWFPSYRDLGERFGLRGATVADHGRINAWPRKREEFGQVLRSETNRARITAVSNGIVDTVRKSIRVADAILDAVSARLEADRLARATPVDLTGKTEAEIKAHHQEMRGRLLDPTGLQRLASATKLAVETQRAQLGLDAMPGAAGSGNGNGEASSAASREHQEFAEELKVRVLDTLFLMNQSPKESGGDAGD